LRESDEIAPHAWRKPRLTHPQGSDDAYLAAFAISGNHELVTFDRGFGRYEAHGLRWHLLEVSGHARMAPG
jgi:predicted nucleic acid-binding protein